MLTLDRFKELAQEFIGKNDNNDDISRVNPRRCIEAYVWCSRKYYKAPSCYDVDDYEKVERAATYRVVHLYVMDGSDDKASIDKSVIDYMSAIGLSMTPRF